MSNQTEVNDKSRAVGQSLLNVGLGGLQLADFSDYKKAIETAISEEHLCKIVEGAEVLYLRGELKMHDDQWPKLTGLISNRIDELNASPNAKLRGCPIEKG